MEPDLEADVIRARRAAELQGDEVLQTAYNQIEADLLQSLLTSPQRDKEGQLELVALLKLNRRYRESLRRTIEQGKVASERLSVMERMRRRFAA